MSIDISRFVSIALATHAYGTRATEKRTTTLDDVSLLSPNASDDLKRAVQQFDEACVAFKPFRSDIDAMQQELPSPVRSAMEALTTAIHGSQPAATSTTTDPSRRDTRRSNAGVTSKGDGASSCDGAPAAASAKAPRAARAATAVLQTVPRTSERQKNAEKQQQANKSETGNCDATDVPKRLTGKKRMTKGRKSNFTHKKNAQKKARSAACVETYEYALMKAQTVPDPLSRTCFFCNEDVDPIDTDVTRSTACCDQLVHLKCATAQEALQKDGKCQQCKVKLQVFRKISLRKTPKSVFDFFTRKMFWGMKDQKDIVHQHQTVCDVARGSKVSLNTDSESLGLWEGKATETQESLLTSLGEEFQRLRSNKVLNFTIHMRIAAFIYRFVRMMGLAGKCERHKPGAHNNVKCACRELLEERYNIHERDFSRYQNVGDLVHNYPILQFILPHDDLDISWRDFADAADAISEACTWMLDNNAVFYESVLALEEEDDDDSDVDDSGSNGGGGAATATRPVCNDEDALSSTSTVPEGK